MFQEGVEWQQLIEDVSSKLFVNANVEIVASGFAQTEGPAWDTDDQSLYFSDTMLNAIFRFKDAQDGDPVAFDKVLHNAGQSDDDSLVFPGPSGLVMYDGQIIVCQHGSRGVSMFDPYLGMLVKVASKYSVGDREVRFNSPSDGVLSADGKYLFFTDSPLGLQHQELNEDHPDLNSLSDTGRSHVFRLKLGSDGNEQAIPVANFHRPKGIALSGDGETMFVSQCCTSDNFDYCKKGEGVWHRFPVVNTSTGEPTIRAGDHENFVMKFEGEGCTSGLTVLPVPGEPGRELVVSVCPGGLCFLETDPDKFKTQPLVARLVFPRALTNVAVGGEHLYITGWGGLWRIKLQPEPAEEEDTSKDDL